MTQERIAYIHNEQTQQLLVAVPKHLATEEFRREARTAKFVRVSLCKLGEFGANNVCVIFEDGSPSPFTMAGMFGDFGRFDGSRRVLCLPVRGSLNTVVVVVNDPELMAAQKSGRMDPETYRKLSLIWAGEGRTNIVKDRGDYWDPDFSVSVSTTFDIS